MTELTASPDVTELTTAEKEAFGYLAHHVLSGETHEFSGNHARLVLNVSANQSRALLALRQEVERLTLERNRWRTAANDGQIFEQPDGSFRYEQFAAFIEQRSRAETAEASLRLATQQREDVVEALRAAQTALNDWTCLYASDMCDPAEVDAAGKRVSEYGTLAYIATVQQKIAEALALQPKEN